jgi:hypothetical protein
MRIIAGLDRPTSGTVRVNGKHYRQAPAPMSELGVLLDARSVHPGLSARDNLLALARTAGLGRRRVAEVIELAGLAEVAGTSALRRIGDRCGPAIPDGEDFVHYDFHSANLLSDGAAITGVIGINPQILAGDRAFDLATFLFYYYDHDEIRGMLRARLLDLAGPRAASAYLAHMVLRQVDWSLRYHPTATATQGYLRLARAVTADIGALGQITG